MTKKSKLIIAGSTIIAGSVITGIAVPLSLKANEPILEQKQEEEQQDDDIKKTEEKNGQAETNKQQVDSTEEKRQNGAESGSGEKTEENSEQAEANKQQVDSPKVNEPTLEQKQEQQDDDSKKTEENSEQVDSQKDSDTQKQQNSAESESAGKTEEDNKVAEQMKSQVDSKSSDTKKQQEQDEAKSTSGGKVKETETIETSERKGKELKSKLTPVQLLFKDDKYFYLRLRASKEEYEKIKNDRLAFTLDKGDLYTNELASEGEQGGHTSYYLNYSDEGKNVSFEITSNQSYGGNNEKGKYKVTKVWLSKDPSETNLLKTDSETVEVK